MPINNKPIAMLILTFAVLLPAGCALSPQTITIRPTLDTMGLSGGGGARVWIDVRDSRRDKILGYRGGVYDTAYISTAEESTGAIRDEIAAAYTALGFTVVDEESPRVNSLVIEIDQLKYTSLKKSIIWEIEIFASVRAVAGSGTREATTSYQDRFTKEYATAPSMQQNEAVINEVFARVLQRLLEDNTVLTLLSGG